MKEIKKMIILSPEENQLNEESVNKFLEYAREHNLKPVGETHYPPILPFEMPEVFIEILKDRFDDCIYVMDDDCLVFANAYNDGRLVDLLEKENITIIHRELKCDLKRIFDVMDQDIIHHLKKAISSAFEEIRNEMNQQSNKIAVFYQDENDKEINAFTEELSSVEDLIVCGVCIPEYDECMKEAVVEVLVSNHICEAVIYDKEMATPEFLECLKELNIDYQYREPDFEMTLGKMGLN